MVLGEAGEWCRKARIRGLIPTAEMDTVAERERGGGERADAARCVTVLRAVANRVGARAASPTGSVRVANRPAQRRQQTDGALLEIARLFFVSSLSSAWPARMQQT